MVNYSSPKETKKRNAKMRALARGEDILALKNSRWIGGPM